MKIHVGDKFKSLDNGCVSEVAMTCIYALDAVKPEIVVYGRSPFNPKSFIYYASVDEFLRNYTSLGSIKPCPFCKEKSEIIDNIENGFDGFDVGCGTDGCYLETGANWNFSTRQEAIEKWNKRSVK